MKKTISAKLILPPLAFLLAAACASALPEVTPAVEAAYAARWPTADAEQLRTGRALFVQRCSGCHVLPTPGKHDATGWEKTVEAMSSRAHLDAPGHEAVLRYLVFTSEARKSPKR